MENLVTFQVHVNANLFQLVQNRNRKTQKDPIGRSVILGYTCITEANLKLLTIGLSSAWKKATIWENWRSVVDMAMLKKNMP